MKGLNSWWNSGTRGENFPGTKFRVIFSKLLSGYLRNDSRAAESLAVVVWPSRVRIRYLRNAGQAAISASLDVGSWAFSRAVALLDWGGLWNMFSISLFYQRDFLIFFDIFFMVRVSFLGTGCQPQDCVWSSLVIDPCGFSAVVYSIHPF